MATSLLLNFGGEEEQLELRFSRYGNRRVSCALSYTSFYPKVAKNLALTVLERVKKQRRKSAGTRITVSTTTLLTDESDCGVH